MKRLITIPLALVVLSPLLSGYTSCSQWDTVVVPSSDTRPPIAIAGYVDDAGKHIWSLGPVDITTTDPNDEIIAVSSAWDAGGARRVHMDRYAAVRCKKGSFGQLTHVDFGPLSASQPGGPGDTVSEGVWTFHTFDVAHFRGYCRSGFEPVKITYSWTVRAEDFFGNVDSQPGNTIEWTKD